MKKVITIIIFCTIFILPIQAQDEGSLYIGIFGRSESNMYKYLKQYNGGFTSVRTSTGYSAGVAIDYTPYYLIKLDARISFSETNYAPEFTAQNGKYYKTNMRLSQIACNVHFNMGSQSKTVNTSFFLGQQFNHILKNTQFYDKGTESESLPVDRLFTQVGMALNINILKQKLLIKPEAGIRFNILGTKKQWENSPNQIFGGLAVAYKIKG